MQVLKNNQTEEKLHFLVIIFRKPIKELLQIAFTTIGVNKRNLISKLWYSVFKIEMTIKIPNSKSMKLLLRTTNTILYK